MRIDYNASSGGIIGIIFWIFFRMKARCVFSLESPHRGDSNEYTQHDIINIKRNSLKNEFEIAVVNEPSVFESLKFYCIFTI